MGLFISKKKISLFEKRISPTNTILLSFVFIILVGTLLLMLPMSSKSAEGASFIDALFTATSATCVTGLAVTDTLTYWTRFGQTVILVLIQCGGLGFMVFATFFSLLMRRRISLRERLIMTQSFSVDELSGIVRLAKEIFLRTMTVEGIGALALSTRFIPRFGFGEGIYKSVFHSISAFCNAGFDVMGTVGHHGSVSAYVSDPVVIITLAALMIFGGLGFLVWEDIKRKRKFHLFSLHSKIVIATTAALLVGGTLLFMIFEYNNDATVGELNFFQKLMALFFQSSTTRTAGFFSVPQDALTPSSKLLSMVLMFIGGSPGSTAGGIKTVTFAVLIVTSVCVMGGKGEVSVFERRISNIQIFKAIAVSVISIMLVSIASVIIIVSNNLYVADVVFECVSAFSTTGLSTGITAELNSLSKIVLVILMYLGRVGLLTMSMGLLIKNRPSKIRKPEGKVIIG